MAMSVVFELAPLFFLSFFFFLSSRAPVREKRRLANTSKGNESAQLFLVDFVSITCRCTNTDETRTMNGSAPEDAVKAAVQTIHKECGILTTLLSANRRPRVYRHHRFFRRSQHALALAKKCFTGKGGGSAVAKARCARGQLASLVMLQRGLVRAAQDCAAELAANRIDTVALSLACLAILSRLGCCVARVVVARNDRDVAAQLWPSALVDYAVMPSSHTSDGGSATAATEGGGRKENAPKDTYGGVLNTLVRRNTLRRK